MPHFKILTALICAAQGIQFEPYDQSCNPGSSHIDDAADDGAGSSFLQMIRRRGRRGSTTDEEGEEGRPPKRAKRMRVTTDKEGPAAVVDAAAKNLANAQQDLYHATDDLLDARNEFARSTGARNNGISKLGASPVALRGVAQAEVYLALAKQTLTDVTKKSTKMLTGALESASPDQRPILQQRFGQILARYQKAASVARVMQLPERARRLADALNVP